MISSVEFRNFRVLRQATLPLSPFTLLIGANGSGKTTALLGLQALGQYRPRYEQVIAAGAEPADVSVEVRWAEPFADTTLRAVWRAIEGGKRFLKSDGPPYENVLLGQRLSGMQVYALSATAISEPVAIAPHPKLGRDGSGLAAVLDHLRDTQPDRLESLNAELSRWMPEFDKILFTTPGQGTRGFKLRRRSDGRSIEATELSHGTLFAVAIVTLAHLPAPPPIICLEDPDHGIHPRLLREVRDALYRLAYPGDFGEDREPTQVIATTHSPFMLDLFRDHPEEIVIAQKTSDGATFGRLSDREHLQEILGDVQLSEAWFSGILGGVPAEG
jgi:predicted ATPase